MTPLVRADRLAKRSASTSCGSRTTRSATRRCRSRIASSSVAVSKAIEFGLGTVACASTGNLANATAAQAAAAGLPAVVLIPYDLEPAKVLGTSIYGARVVGVQGDVRRRQPPVLRDRRQVRLGLRQREPAAVLRRGIEELRLRDRRAARLAAAGARRGADGGRLAGHQDRQGVRRVREAGAGRGARRASRASTARRRPAARPSSTWCWRTATRCGR